MGAGKISAIVIVLLSFSILPGSAQAKYSGGSGTPEDPYLISTPEDMNQIGRNYTDWDKCFKLTADINLSAYTGTQFSRIGIDEMHAFSGVFDGNGHTISGFTHTAPTRDYIGIFGNNNGTVENVSLVDVNITGRNYVGGLVGENDGGDHWTRLTGNGWPEGSLGRIGIDSYRKNGNIVYANVEGPGGGRGGAGGGRGGAGAADTTGGRGGAAAPAPAATTGVYRSDDGGNSWWKVSGTNPWSGRTCASCDDRRVSLR